MSLSDPTLTAIPVDAGQGGLPATRAVVDLAAVARNLGRLRARLAPTTRVVGVVKAGGYGHGLVAVARRLEAAGVDGLGVAVVEEAAALRGAGVTTPILVLSPGYEAAAAVVVELALEVVVSDLAELAPLEAAARRAGRPVGIHLKVDTGMGRLGLDAPHLETALARLHHAPYLRLAGVMSHLACADEEGAFTGEQIDAFATLRPRLAAAGFGAIPLHLANTAGVVHFPAAHFDMVRPGLGLYGYGAVDLEPVLTLETRVVRVRHLAAGATVGYGRTFRCGRPTRMGVVRIGYGDGLPRALSNRGCLLVAGRRCPIIGRVNMDLTCIDLTDAPAAAVGSVAVVIGRQGGERITADEVAAQTGTIAYEVLCSIGPRVARVYGGGE
ncbi:MAG: alanine racemase [Deltaproteobacteria bacterium]|nr:alanine racemase [Deltaproteobacteria bacterium]PJB96081.1 MAG: alanine racemase [Nitrospirae bacterium CG_4_9_14_0_8_um_filter_70_14]